MDELQELARQAELLRGRIAAFLNDMGEYAPPLRQIHNDLAEIDELLAAQLADHGDA